MSARAAELGPEEMSERLRGFLAREHGVAVSAVDVTGLRRLPGGSSREIWAFRAEVGGEALDLVARRDPPGRDDGDRGAEYRVVCAAHEAGVLVPRPRGACTDPEVLGTSFYLMDRVEGEALPRRLLRDASYEKTREVLLGQMVEQLVRIHAIDPDQPGLAGLPEGEGESPARSEIGRVLEGIRSLAAEPHPLLELAARWLLERVPGGARRTLLHGDFRVGNVLFDEAGLRAVLDWELSKVGDPVEDLGWLCTRAWRFGSDKPAGGIGTREELLAAYAAAGGGEVELAHLRFWEAVGSFKVALVFIQQSWVHRTGRVSSLELASLGRRTAEAEKALLECMEEAV